MSATKTKFKLDFNKPLIGLEGFPIQGVRPGIKAGAAIDENAFEDLFANRLVALAIANGSEELGGKEFIWMKTLYTEGILELDIVDTRVLKDFIKECKKKNKPNFTNVVLHQLSEIFDVAGFKEK
jgi:hypothetical protein